MEGLSSRFSSGDRITKRRLDDRDRRGTVIYVNNFMLVVQWDDIPYRCSSYRWDEVGGFRKLCALELLADLGEAER